MKNFDLNKVILLISSIISSNKRVIIKNSLIILLFITFVFIISLFTKEKNIGHVFSKIVSISYFIIAVYALSFFKIFNNKRRINTTHLLPASKSEKFFSLFFLSLIIVPFVVIVFYVVVITLFWAITLLFGNQESYESVMRILLFDRDGLMTLLMIHATGVFSGIIFKKRPYIGYLCALGLVIFYYMFILGYVLKQIFNEIPVADETIMDILPEYFPTINLSLSILYVVVLWTLSYRFFKKIQLT